MASKGSDLLRWENMFDANNEMGGDKIRIPDIPDDDGDMGAPKKGGSKNKRLSVERIYQKKSQLEHILLRPDTYIGSVEKVTQPMWVVNEDTNLMEQREVTFCPGLYKIFDEILVNAADNKQRDPGMNTIKIDIDRENCKIRVWNNGKGIPVVEHKTEKMYVPSLIFGVLLTSSNYDDDQKKVTGGRNGYGAKLCNVFSTKFTVETQCNEYKKAFRQTWSNNMSKTGEAKITESRGEDYTCVTFWPDLTKFTMDSLDKDIVDIFSRRAYDIAASSRGVRVMLNGKRVPVKNFKDYIDLYIKDKVDDNGQPVKLVHEVCTDRWEVGVCISEKGFQQASFVNSIATTKGGRHVDYIADQIVTKLVDVIKKKEKKGGVVVKPFQVKNHMWVFVNCLVENPTFDSQTKENMTKQAKSFGSKCALSEKFITQVSKCGIVEAIQSWMKFKAQAQLNKKGGAKTNKLKGVPKLDDANDAGTKNSINCTLILTEGDSAKALAVAGLGIVGRDRYGVFPLRGKVLNVREATHKQIMENIEINNMIKIIGLRYKEKYETPETLKTLRYGRMMIMTDQDQDGSHIKGLLINFIHHNWPNLLKHGFVEEFITPIVKATKNKVEKAMYSLPEFEEWKSETPNWHTYKVKYYKGLGTSTAKEAKEYFQDMLRHRIDFRYQGAEDDASILLAFSKKKIEERKEWLTNWMEERKRRAQLGLPEMYLYGKNTKSITYNEFINRELILFSNMDNERSIPSLVDGLKPGQRKVMFTCFKRNLIKELKVAQLAGSVAEMSAYHHGEVSLMSTIVNLAQNFVGSNNLNLLQPIGQFGTRLHGGKDAASVRYIFTALSPLARFVFNVKDDALLNYLYDDNQKIEPEWYMPILPMVLVNGADGIGTGWSTKIPNHDPRLIVRNLLRMLDGQSPQPMSPWYKNFKGTVEAVDPQKYVVNGEVSVLDDNSLDISELPIKTWTQTYKEGVLEPMLQGTDKIPSLITDYKEYHTDSTVRFVVKLSQEKLQHSEAQGLHKVFKLQTAINLTSMVLFDASGCIKRYNDVLDILREFFTVRLDFYQRRKDYLEGMLSAESLKLDNQARFILEKIEGEITIENKPKKEMIQILVRRGYDSDPVKAWKQSQEKLRKMDMDDLNEEESEEGEKGPDYNYILGMALWCLTKEKKEELCKQRDDKAEELYQLRKKSREDLWRDDLNAFLVELDKVEAEEAADMIVKPKAAVKSAKGRSQKKMFSSANETDPSPHGRRVEPKIDPALRAKAEAANRAAQRKKERKETAADMFDDMDDEDSKGGLADRIGNKLGMKRDHPDLLALSPPAGKAKPDSTTGAPAPAAAAAAAKPKPRARGKAAAGDKPAATKRGSPKKKGGKKKNPWSDSEDDQSGMSGSGGSDLDTSMSSLPRERAPPRRQAASKAKYNFDTDSDKGPAFSDSEDDESKPKKMSNGAGAKSDDNDNDSDVAPSKESSEPPTRFDDSDGSDFGSRTAPSTTEDIFNRESSTRPKSPVFSVSDSDDEPINIPTPLPPKVDPPKKTAKPKTTSEPAKKKAPAKRKPKFSDLSDLTDEELVAPPKKAPAKKRAPAKKKVVVNSDDSDDGLPSKSKKSKKNDDDWDAIVNPKKKPAPKRKKKAESDEDDDDMDAIPDAPRAAASGRSRKPVKYNFGGDSEDDDDFY